VVSLETGEKTHLENPSFLIAEDNISEIQDITELLGQVFDDCKITTTPSIEETFIRLESEAFDMVFIASHILGEKTPEVVSTISMLIPNTPIIVLTNSSDDNFLLRTIKMGAQEFIEKSDLTKERLAKSITYAYERKILESDLHSTLNTLHNKNEKLKQLTLHDPLTQIPNRLYLYEVGELTIRRANRSNSVVGLIFIDLNDFKKVNDYYGHKVGDALLREVANRLTECTRDNEIVTRISGDEFVILTDLLPSEKSITSMLNRVNRALESPAHIEGNYIPVVPSIGVAFFPDASNLDELIQHADYAMYEAKKSGSSRNTCIYDKDLDDKYSRVCAIERALGRAVSNDEISVFFQPIFSSDSKSVKIEALVRWHSDELGNVSPNEFIELAEATPLINDITRLVLKQSAELTRQLEAIPGIHVAYISVNICAKQLEHSHFDELLIGWFNEFSIPPHLICLEITERQLVNNIKESSSRLNNLKKLGIKISLDDYGTGFSSLAHIQNLDIDILKLDKSLLTGIDTNKKNYALIAGIITMAYHMNINVTAEGVETTGEFDAVIRLGADNVQGYFYSKPLTLDDTIEFYRAI